MARKMKIEQESIMKSTENVEEVEKDTEVLNSYSFDDGLTDDTSIDEVDFKEDGDANDKQLELGVLKVHVDEHIPVDDEFETLWNELVAVYRGRKVVSVIVTGIEKTKTQGYVVVAYYKTQRILVPMTEMMVNLDDERGEGYTETEKLARVCNAMLGGEIDVIIKGIDKLSKSIVASRKEAMYRKRKRFYLTPLSDGLPQIRVGRIVEARIVATTQSAARIEVFGVETTLKGSQLSWDWIADVSDKFYVGDTIDVLITEIGGDSVENIKVTCDAKSLTKNVSKDNLDKCAVQNKYIGEITNVRNGVAYIRLKIGVNAIAHTNYDRRTPARGDIVSFVITRINHGHANVSGIITKIIKQVV